MTVENFSMWYLILGIFTAIINGFVRKMEAEPLLGLTWILAWWMTLIALIVRAVCYLYKSLDNYQVVRRVKIFILRNF